MSLHPSQLLRHPLPDRRLYLGASEVGPIYRVPCFSTEYAVWADKTSPERLPDRDTGPQEAGRDFEPSVYAIAGKRLGCKMIPGDAYTTRPLCVQDDPSHPLGAHPDAWANEDGDWLPVECKTISHSRHEWPEDGATSGFPVHYDLQLRAQIACCPKTVKHGYLVAALSFDDVRIYRIERDDVLEAEMLAFIREWWDLRVLAMSEPDVDGSDRCASWLYARFPRETAAIRDADGDEALIVEDWRAAKDALDDAKRIEDVTKARLQRLIGESEGLRSALGVVTWKAQTAERIDTKALRRDFPDAATACTTQSASRVLRWRAGK